MKALYFQYQGYVNRIKMVFYHQGYLPESKYG